MKTGTTPFIRSVRSDCAFQLFHKKPVVFWDLFSEMKGKKNFYSNSFMDLISKMLKYRPDKRINLEEILNHPYLQKG
jgi:serine/threonine protein kinase